jgi:1,4-dihydroxy-6-naphthoate synthase
MLERYLDMYASDASVTLSESQLRALDTLYRIGYEHGLWPCPLHTQDYLIPLEYEKLRAL